MAKTYLTSEELLDADVALQPELDAVTTALGLAAGFALNNVITPAQITASTNDYSPAGLATAMVLRISTSGVFNIAGLAGGGNGRVIILHNVGANAFILIPESASSAAANRFSLSKEVIVYSNQSVTLQYDATLTRWKSITEPDFIPITSLLTTTRGTASATFASIHQLTTGVIPAGNYFVDVWIYGSNATGINSATSSAGFYRVRADGGAIGPAPIFMPVTTHLGNNNPAYITNSCSQFSYPVTLTNGSHTINLDTATDGGTFNVTYSVITLRRNQ